MECHCLPPNQISPEEMLTRRTSAFTGFLNDIIAQLWPNICVAGSKMTQDIANPMFKEMLPGPLASLHFTKVNFGPKPMTVSNVLATKTDTDGIKLDLNLNWDGNCDIELDGKMIPTLVSLLFCRLGTHALLLSRSSRAAGSRKRQTQWPTLRLAMSSDKRHPIGM